MDRTSNFYAIFFDSGYAGKDEKKMLHFTLRKLLFGRPQKEFSPQWVVPNMLQQNCDWLINESSYTHINQRRHCSVSTKDSAPGAINMLTHPTQPEL